MNKWFVIITIVFFALAGLAWINGQREEVKKLVDTPNQIQALEDKTKQGIDQLTTETANGLIDAAVTLEKEKIEPTQGELSVEDTVKNQLIGLIQFLLIVGALIFVGVVVSAVKSWF